MNDIRRYSSYRSHAAIGRKGYAETVPTCRRWESSSFPSGQISVLFMGSWMFRSKPTQDGLRRRFDGPFDHLSSSLLLQLDLGQLEPITPPCERITSPARSPFALRLEIMDRQCERGVRHTPQQQSQQKWDREKNWASFARSLTLTRPEP